MQAIHPSALGLQKGTPLSFAYYAPANTQLQLCDPSLLPNMHLIQVFNGATTGTYVTYMITVNNMFLTQIGEQ